jgi:hypothetical protein
MGLDIKWLEFGTYFKCQLRVEKDIVKIEEIAPIC